MPRVRLNPELMIFTVEPGSEPEKTLGELPTALGMKFDRPSKTKAVRATEEVTKEKDVPGRPTKYADEMERRAYELALLGCSEKVMSVALGIDVATLRDWMKTREAFSLVVREGKTLADAKVARKIYEQALDGSLPHQRWWMAVRQRGAWPLVDDKSGLTVNVNATQTDATFAYTDTRDAAVAYRAFINGDPLPQLPSRMIDVPPEADDE